MESPSEFAYKDQARNKLIEGIQKLTRVVAPHFASKEVDVLSFGEGMRLSTLDLLRQVKADDPFVDAGIELGKDLARRVYKERGDGVTTSLLCLSALVERGMQHIRRAHSFINFRNGIEKALKVSLEALEKQAIPLSPSSDGRILKEKLSNDLDLREEHLATIERIVGRGIFIVEQGKEVDDQIEFSSAISMKARIASHYFLQGFEHPYREMSDVLIALIEGKVDSIQELLPLLKWVQRENKSLLLIAEGFSEDVLATLLLNVMKGKINLLAMRPPKLTKEAMVSWKRLLIENCHMGIMKIGDLLDLNKTIDSLGFVKKAAIRSDQLSLFSPTIQKFQKVDVRELFSKNKPTDELYIAVRIKLKEEIDPMKREKRQRKMQKTFRFIEEAREKGMVIGGGIALYSAIEELDKLGLSGDENLGADCVRAALAAPLKQIIESSGLNQGNAWKKLRKIGAGFGVDLRKKKIVPMAKEAIFDSLSVLSYSLQEAVKQASLVLTSEAIVTKSD